MRPGGAEARYAAVMNQFATVHHADSNNQPSRYVAAVSRFAETLHPAGHRDLVHHADSSKHSSRYVAAVSCFAEALHPACRRDPPSPCDAATPVNPFLACWPRVGENPGSDHSDTADTGGTNHPGGAPTCVDVVRGLSGHWPRPLTDEALVPLLTAADRAQVLFPGPVGELIHREIHAYLEIGHRFGGNTLISRLAEQLLATPDRPADPVAVPRPSREAIR